MDGYGGNWVVLLEKFIIKNLFTLYFGETTIPKEKGEIDKFKT